MKRTLQELSKSYLSIFFSSGGLILKQDLLCCGNFRSTKALGVGILEVVPSSSGLAELDVRFEEVSVQFSSVSSLGPIP